MRQEDKLNGSVDILAEAMRQVFTEAVEGAVDPLTTEVKALRTEVKMTRSRRRTKTCKRSLPSRKRRSANSSKIALWRSNSLVPPLGLEPRTLSLGGLCSIQLS